MLEVNLFVTAVAVHGVGFNWSMFHGVVGLGEDLQETPHI